MWAAGSAGSKSYFAPTSSGNHREKIGLVFFFSNLPFIKKNAALELYVANLFRNERSSWSIYQTDI
jgi:hypothetical protein